MSHFFFVFCYAQFHIFKIQHNYGVSLYYLKSIKNTYFHILVFLKLFLTKNWNFHCLIGAIPIYDHYVHCFPPEFIRKMTKMIILLWTFVLTWPNMIFYWWKYPLLYTCLMNEIIAFINIRISVFCMWNKTGDSFHNSYNIDDIVLCFDIPSTILL